MTDITTDHWETVDQALYLTGLVKPRTPGVHIGEARKALYALRTEMEQLRTVAQGEVDAIVMEALARAKRERDEAVAALRKVAYGRTPEMAKTYARQALARLSTPKEPEEA